MKLQSLRRVFVVGCRQHFEVTELMFEADIAVIADVEQASTALFRGDLNDTRGSSGAIFGRFRGILQDNKAFNIGRIDR